MVSRNHCWTMGWKRSRDMRWKDYRKTREVESNRGESGVVVFVRVKALAIARCCWSNASALRATIISRSRAIAFALVSTQCRRLRAARSSDRRRDTTTAFRSEQKMKRCQRRHQRLVGRRSGNLAEVTGTLVSAFGTNSCSDQVLAADCAGDAET